MLKKIVIATGVGTALLLGGGGAALAAAPSPSSHSPASSTHHHKHKHHPKRVFRGEYGQWTTYNAKTKVPIIHDGVRGTVSAVSPNSVSIKAKDGTVKTYVLNSSTRVHAKGDTRAKPGTLSQVKVGDHAQVIGTGTSILTATHISEKGAVKTK